MLFVRKFGDKKSAINQSTKQAVLDYLENKGIAKSSEIAEAINLKQSRTRDYLNDLIAEGKVIKQGANKNRIYKLNNG